MEHFTPATLFGMVSAFGAITAVGGAWFHARYARKLGVKVGDIAVEGQTVKQVRTLLSDAEALQQRLEARRHGAANWSFSKTRGRR